jgi:hypothetical protein
MYRCPRKSLAQLIRGYRDGCPADNSRECVLTFKVDESIAPATIHGLAGYFDCELYKKVRLSTVPSSHTPDMHSWFPIFFPLRHPVRVEAGSTLTVAMWRITRKSKARQHCALSLTSHSKGSFCRCCTISSATLTGFDILLSACIKRDYFKLLARCHAFNRCSRSQKIAIERAARTCINAFLPDYVSVQLTLIC